MGICRASDSVDRRHHAQVFECGHLAQRARRRLHQWDREQPAGALAESQPEIEERSEAKVLECDGGTGLGRAVGGDQVVDGPLTQRRRDQRGGVGGHAVEHHGHTARRRREDHARQRRVLQATDCREDGQWVARDDLMPLQCRCHDRPLVGQRSVVDARPASRHRLGGGAGQRGDQACRGRGVGDAHVAGDQQVGTVVDQLVGQGGAGQQPPGRLVV